MVGLSRCVGWTRALWVWAAVSLGGTIGCGDGIDPAQGAGPDTPPGTTGQNETLQGDDGGTTDNGNETDDGEPPPDSETGDGSTGSEDLSCELDCGENGICVEDEDGSVYCDCDDKAVDLHLDCITCTTIDGPVDANVPKVDVVVNVLINDAEPPNSPVETGRLVLRNTASGDEVYLGQTQDGTLTRTIVPGAYEVYYERVDGGTLVPVNSRAFIGVRIFDDAGTMTLNIPMMQISGDITVNGEEPPDSGVDWGRIVLRDVDTGDRAPIGASSNGGFVANVLPGDYEIHYEARESSLHMPANEDAYLGKIEVASDPDLRQQFAVDIPVATVEGDITLNGGDPPNSPAERGRIVYVDRRTGEEIQVALTSDGGYDVRLVTAEYDLFYQRLAGGNLVPLNSWGHLGKAVINKSGTKHIDIKTGHLDGSFLVGSNPPPQDASDDGVLLLRTELGDSVVLGNTAQQTFSAHVINGTYDVYYAQQTAGATLPANTNARVDTLTVAGNGAPVLDVPVATIGGTLTLSGELPPDSVYDDGRVYLRNRETGDSALLGNTRLGSYSANVIPGTYDIVYEAEIADQFMPVNKSALLQEGLPVVDGQSVNVNIAVEQVAGEMLLENRPVPASTGEIANLYLEDVVTGDLIWLGSAASPAFDRPLAPGRYLVRYQAQGAGETLPGNLDAPVACLELPAPPE